MFLLGPLLYLLSGSVVGTTVGILLSFLLVGAFLLGILTVRFWLMTVAILGWFVVGFVATVSQIRC